VRDLIKMCIRKFLHKTSFVCAITK